MGTQRQNSFGRKDHQESSEMTQNSKLPDGFRSLPHDDPTLEELPSGPTIQNSIVPGALHRLKVPAPVATVESEIKTLMRTISKFVSENLREAPSIGFRGESTDPIDLSEVLSCFQKVQGRLEEKSFPSELSRLNGIEMSGISTLVSRHLDEALDILSDNRMSHGLRESEQEFVLMYLIGLREELAEVYQRSHLSRIQTLISNESEIFAKYSHAHDGMVDLSALAAFMPGGVAEQSLERIQEIISGEFPSLAGIAHTVHQESVKLLQEVRGYTPSSLGFHEQRTKPFTLDTSKAVEALRGAVAELSEIYFEREVKSPYHVQLCSFAHSLMSFSDALLVQLVRNSQGGIYQEQELSVLKQAASKALACASDITRQSIAFIEEIEREYAQAG